MENSSVARASRQLAATLNRPRCRLRSLLLGGLILVPTQAMADEIPFFATNNTDAGMCIACNGPWARSSLANSIPPGRWEFYDAEINLFSPYGLWNCFFGGPEPDSCNIFGGPHISLCVSADDPERVTPVELTFDGSTLQANFPPPPCGFGEAGAFLGDPASPGRRDHDVFKFDGVAGDTITVRLGRDGARGSTGEIAKVSLGKVGGGTLDAREGALPLELTVTLPSTGKYALEAREVRDSAAGFRGHYRLAVTSTRGVHPLLEPAQPTEP